MKKRVSIAAGVLIAFIALIVAVPRLVPTGVYKQKLAEEVEAATGRKLSIGGEVSVSVLPGIGIEVNDVAIANASWARAPEMASLAKMAVRLAVLPLLTGRIEIKRLELIDPVVRLEVNDAGQTNWEFTRTETQPDTAEGERGASGEVDKTDNAEPAALRADDIRVVNGTFIYSDSATEEPIEIRKINIDMAVSLPDAGSPPEPDGKLTYRPYIQAILAIDTLDLTRFVAEGNDTKQPSDKSARQQSPAPAHSGWSDTPFNLTFLRAADADLALSADQIRIGELVIDESVVAISLKSGLLTADLSRFALYGGRGRGQVKIDVATGIPVFQGSFSLAGANAAPLLAAVAGLHQLEGKANADVSLSASGRSALELVGSVAGNGSLTFTDGTIRGVNLAAMVQNIVTAFVASSARRTDRTDFAELSGTFVASDGIVHNNDLELLSPLLRLRGNGTINLPDRTLNYRLEPTFVSSLKGKITPSDEIGVLVPVLVYGPWHDPSYRPDLAGMAREAIGIPEKAVKSLERPARSLRNLFGR